MPVNADMKYCPKCEQETAIENGHGRCSWCSGPLYATRAAAERAAELAAAPAPKPDATATAGPAPERDPGQAGGFEDRSLAQRQEALRLANEIRQCRAELKRDLKAGRESARQILLRPPEYANTMKVFDLLLAMPKWGRVKVNKALVHAATSPSKTLGGLSDRQRMELARRFPIAPSRSECTTRERRAA